MPLTAPRPVAGCYGRRRPLGERHGAALAALRQPEGDALAMDVLPAQAGAFAKPRARIDQEDAEAAVELRFLEDGGEEPRLLVRFQKADPARLLLQAFEFRQAPDVAHPVGLAQQLAERRHLPVDRRIAVAARAQRGDQRVQHGVGKFRKCRAEENLVEFADKGGHVVFVGASPAPKEDRHSVREGDAGRHAGLSGYPCPEADNEGDKCR